MSRPLVFIDCETTGLRPDKHELVEVAWAVGDGPVASVVLPHLFERPDPVALKVNRYLDRELYDPDNWSSPEQVDLLWDAVRGATLVGANVRFDAAFLAAHHGEEVWHHRLLDVEAYAMAALHLDEMPSLSSLVTMLREHAYEIPDPDHTAANDVRATRAIFDALRHQTYLSQARRLSA